METSKFWGSKSKNSFDFHTHHNKRLMMGFHDQIPSKAKYAAIRNYVNRDALDRWSEKYSFLNQTDKAIHVGHRQDFLDQALNHRGLRKLRQPGMFWGA